MVLGSALTLGVTGWLGPAQELESAQSSVTIAASERVSAGGRVPTSAAQPLAAGPETRAVVQEAQPQTEPGTVAEEPERPAAAAAVDGTDSDPVEPSAQIGQAMPAAQAPPAQVRSTADAPKPPAMTAAAPPSLPAPRPDSIPRPTPAAAAVSASQPQIQSAPSAPVAEKGAAPVATPKPVDPESEDAKLAAAAQVRVKGDTVIDSMLDQALIPQQKTAPAAAASAPGLPATPTRDDVVKAMSVLVPAIRGCAQGQSGLAPMSIVVSSDGRVESAALSSGPFQGSASGRCMEGVVRRARFPRFKQANFRVQFPFSIQ